MKRRLCIVIIAIGLGEWTAASVCWAAAPGPQALLKRSAASKLQADDLTGQQYAYGRRNPRWDAPYRGPAPKLQKPYKPLRQPPGNLPEHQKRGRHGSLLFNSSVIAAVAGILILAVAAEWLAAVLGISSAALAVGLGLAIGPAAGLLEPAALFGSLLLPALALCVAVMIFERGLQFRAADMGEVRRLVGRLVTVGAPATGLIGMLAAFLIAGLPLSLAALFGALCSLTGPPALLAAEADGRVHEGLRWESAALDCVATVATVLVFEAVFTLAHRPEMGQAVMNIVKTLWIGGLVGVVGAGGILVLLRYELIPERLVRAVLYIGVVALFAAAHLLRTDAGFVAVAAMGLALANQTIVRIAPAVLSANLSPLLGSALCVVVAALLGVEDVAELSVEGTCLLGVVFLVARPVGVLLATTWSRVSWRERVALSWSAPRGVVALTLAAIFGMRLDEIRNLEAARFAPLLLMVLLGAVLVSNLCGWLTMRLLGATEPSSEMVRRPTTAAE